MCLSPLLLKNPLYGTPSEGSSAYQYNIVPCGKCYECKEQMRTDWSIRLYEESKNWKYASFMTLTFAEGILPIRGAFVEKNKLYHFYELDFNYWKLYYDRVLSTYKRLTGVKADCVHFACGEYGSKTIRPHFHCLWYFNDPKLFDIFRTSWNYGLIYYRMHIGSTPVDYISLSKTYNPVVMKVTRYVSKYIAKTPNYQNEELNELLKEVQPPALRVSRNLGISYLQNDTFKDLLLRLSALRAKKQLISPEGFRLLWEVSQYRYIDANGKECSVQLPKFYQNKIFYRYAKKTKSCISCSVVRTPGIDIPEDVSEEVRELISELDIDLSGDEESTFSEATESTRVLRKNWLGIAYAEYLRCLLEFQMAQREQGYETLQEAYRVISSEDAAARARRERRYFDRRKREAQSDFY